MGNTKLSELLRIISSEHPRVHRHSNLDSRPYTPRGFNRVRQQDYRARHYEANKKPNKIGYK
jgi:hypothetical protein